MSDSTSKPRKRKATKAKPDNRPPTPYPDFPLYAHPLGYWAKKINGAIKYFGRWGKMVDGAVVRIGKDNKPVDPASKDETWSGALELFNAQKDDLYAGRKPRVRLTSDGKIDNSVLTIKKLGDTFLTAKMRKVESGEIGRRSFQDYREVCQFIADYFGKDRPVDDLAADDFEKLRAEMAKRWGPVRLGNTITRIRSVFKYAVDNDLILRSPRYGSEFNKPGKATLRKHRVERGTKMFEADEIRRMLGLPPWAPAVDTQWEAMVLLAVNCGFGNHDIARLPLSALDLENGWLDFPRPKTGIERRIPLWPETVVALNAAIAGRAKPHVAADADLVFLTENGRRLHYDTENGKVDRISVIFKGLLKKLGLHRKGHGFYVFRHVFETIACEVPDQVAVDLVMGHSDPSMAAHYRERVADKRLIAVTQHVRHWLFGKTPDDETTEERSVEARQPVAPQRSENVPARATLKLYVG